ncbi:hypothetical protein [Amycolatopsis sp. NPDC051128]|uniref:PPE domain-containing protein n=1 Tax=Amycolatopsis sp. NPDC051128 TaxID=3155412 RepID=UPI003419E0C8
MKLTEGPLTAAQIYQQITGGEGTRPLIEAQDGADQLTQRMIERASRISALRAKTMSGWQGGAGDAAADSTAPLVQAAMDDAIHLKNAQSAVGAQMDSFGTAKNSVKPVAAQPPELTSQDIVDVATGKGWGGYSTKVTSWQADSQANIDAFRAYHSASTTNGGQMPAQYAQLADSGAPIALDTGTPTPGKTTGTGTGQRTQSARQTRQPAVPNQTQYRPDTQAGQNQTGQNQTGQDQVGSQTPGSTTPSASDETHANSYVPKPVMPPAASTGYQFGPTGQPVNPFGPYGTSEFGPGTGYGPGSGGYGPGGGSGGYRGTGSGAVNEPGARGMGPGSGSGRGVPGENVTGGRPGAAGAVGGRGANGMPMGAGAGQGKKEEDKEKKAAAYLRNPDPDDTFAGDIEKPMPPVIGEKPKK